jgi:hypothetical protein
MGSCSIRSKSISPPPQRKLLTPDDFPNLDVLAERLTAFENRYNHAARPFDWRFNRDDLNRLLTRIAA